MTYTNNATTASINETTAVVYYHSPGILMNINYISYGISRRTHYSVISLLQAGVVILLCLETGCVIFILLYIVVGLGMNAAEACII